MSLKNFFGFGKDTLLEWFIQTYHLEANESRDDPSNVSDVPNTSWVWKGLTGTTRIAIPTGNSTSKFRTDGDILYVYLGQYGNEKDLILYRPKSMDGLPSMNDHNWETRAKEEGLMLEEFALDPECNWNLFLNIKIIRLLQEQIRSCSEGVDAIIVSLPGVVVEFKKSADPHRIPDDMRCAEKILEIARRVSAA